MNGDSLLSKMWARICTWWPIKITSTAVGMTAFFIAYFWIQRNPFFPITAVPLTALDRMIAFRPEALLVYASLWPYVSLAPALLTDRRVFVSYWIAAAIISIIGLGIFFLWPTDVLWSDVNWSQHPSFLFLKSIDAQANACPSLHVAFAVFTAMWLNRLLREMNSGGWARVLNWFWCIGILYSTMAVRQHAALDVYCGAVLGVVAGAVQMHTLRSVKV